MDNYDCLRPGQDDITKQMLEKQVIEARKFFYDLVSQHSAAGAEWFRYERQGLLKREDLLYILVQSFFYDFTRMQQVALDLKNNAPFMVASEAQIEEMRDNLRKLQDEKKKGE